MEELTYKVYKDNQLIHIGQCPSMLFVNIFPLQDVNLYDYIEVEYGEVVFTLNNSHREAIWK